MSTPTPRTHEIYLVLCCSSSSEEAAEAAATTTLPSSPTFHWYNGIISSVTEVYRGIDNPYNPWVYYVTEAMPSNAQKVEIACIKDDGIPVIDMGMRIDGVWWSRSIRTIENVYAWRPLPTPPPLER